MPFAALPSSPGFMQPAAPDWGRFAALAIEGINKGTDIRERAGQRLTESIDKSVAQVSAIMKYQSPLEKSKRHMEMMKNQIMEQVYRDYQLHPEKYQMTANGPIQKDPLTVLQKAATYRNTLKTGQTMDINIKDKQRSDASNAAAAALRAKAAYQNKQIGAADAQPDASKDTTLEPAPDQPPAADGSNAPLPVPATPAEQDYSNWPAGTTPQEVFPNEEGKSAPDSVITDPNDPRLKE
jgi:hypothetical protein